MKKRHILKINSEKFRKSFLNSDLIFMKLKQYSLTYFPFLLNTAIPLCLKIGRKLANNPKIAIFNNIDVNDWVSCDTYLMVRW